MSLVNDQSQNDDNTSESGRRRLKAKNWVLFAALIGFVVIVYFVSIVKMSGG